MCSQVEYVEETHPPTRENLIKLLAAVDKRDKYRFFVKPVTEEQVWLLLLHLKQASLLKALTLYPLHLLAIAMSAGLKRFATML